MDIKVYTKENCPECVKVKHYLNNEGYEFEEISINPDNITDLMNYTRSAPAVFVDDVFYNNTEVIAGAFSTENVFEDIKLEFEL